ncbi:MAG: Nramp family divalent metal transporter [Chitinophagaceae bacterium]|nr:Nramp family divalent metal transporter [Chitinophagaceae bacterium]
MAHSKNKQKNRLHQFWRRLGPGLITGASDDDPSGIATYSQAGARFGLTTLWVAVVSYPLMYVIQEMCARIGIVSNRGLAGVVKDHYPRWVLYVLIAFSCPAIVLNIAADIAGMGAVANLIFPAVPPPVFSIVFTASLLFFTVKLSYRKLASIMKFLCLVLLVYLAVPFFTRPDLGQIITNTFIPRTSLDKDYMMVLVGVLGTTISPYLFFWQTSMEVEMFPEKKNHIVLDKYILPVMKSDIRYGMFFSVLVMYFITLTAGTVLHENGVLQINTVEDAAKALRPLAGEMAYVLFAVGVIGISFLAIPVLAGSVSYIIAETMGWKEGLNKKFHEARGFYIVMIVSTLVGLVIQLAGVDPVKALLFTAVLYGITAPVLIGILLHICNSRKIMEEYTNKPLVNILGFVALLLMGLSAGLLIWFLVR